MNNSTLKEETLHVIRAVEDNPSLNQRLLSRELNISLGKANYLLKELIKKGMVKIGTFSRHSSKKKKRKLQYVLTPKGLQEKMKLTYHFLQVKEAEFNKLKQEYERYQNGDHE